MRLLLVGAFSFPHTLGSPVYFREQARALRDAGADVHLLTYGPPPPARGAEPEPGRGADDRSPDEPARDAFAQTVIPTWARPTSRRSGPNLGKPVADLALAAALRGLVARSHPGSDSRSERASSDASKAASSKAESDLRRASFQARPEEAPPFDAILAHHAEAALAALHFLPRRRPPVVYCAHTLLQHELPEYLKPPTPKRFFEGTRSDPAAADESMTQSRARRMLARVGRVIDRDLARRADAWIALTQTSTRVIGADARGPGRWIAPPVGDLQRDPERLEAEANALARALGLERDGFFLYVGNLDPYQDLPLLERVAHVARARKGNAFPIVVATHDEAVGAGAGASASAGAGAGDEAVGGSALREGCGERGLRRVRVRSASEANALVVAARATIVPRRSVGGFPIKLLNSLVLGRAVVAFHGEEWGLVDGVDALVCDPTRPEASILAALAALEADADLARRLGAGARSTWLARHQPDRVAADTLDLIAKLG